MFHRHSVTGDDLRAGHNQIDGEAGKEQSGKGHSPIGDISRDRSQETVDSDDGNATGTDDHLSWDSRNEPSSQESNHGADDGQGQVLQPDCDQTIAADCDHVDIHIPEEDTQTHKGEEDREHEETKGRSAPDIERQNWFLSNFDFPVGKCCKVDKGDDKESDLVGAVPSNERSLTVHTVNDDLLPEWIALTSRQS
jgi:hypothetical protein